MKTTHPLTLIILDGWGHSDSTDHNPTQSVETPTIDHLFKDYPWTLISASGEDVGLPEGQIGNSEVGHLHLGAGRLLRQDLVRISHAIETGEFAECPELLNAINIAKQNNKAVHIMGLCSPGGVHSHQAHILAMAKLCSDLKVDQTYLHAMLDGRDVPPRSAEASLEYFDSAFKDLHNCKIASVIGRYYAMDRDKRWDRIETAYNLYTEGKAEFTASSAVDALKAAYARDENDEFVKATAIHDENQSVIKIEDGDVVIFMNFRADRARQICTALTDPNFTEFKRKVVPKIADFVTLTQYSSELKVNVAFPKQALDNTLGEYLANQGMNQLRIAETEKYAHVTYFFNGGHEAPNKNEDRELIASPKVATYDLQPEMSAIELTDKLVAAIESKQYDVIICNYANPDMVGHTGKMDAAEKAVIVIDECLKRVEAASKSACNELLITADHGNVEKMYDEQHDQPYTAHTTNLVPLIYVGRKASFRDIKGSLSDVAPTMLSLLNLETPAEMTGRDLLEMDE